MARRPAESRALIGAAVGVVISIIGGAALFLGIGWSDRSYHPAVWLENAVGLLGCIGCPAGGITFLLSLALYAVNRKSAGSAPQQRVDRHDS